MNNHIFKVHAEETETQPSTLLKVESRYDKDYWLFVDVAETATLTHLDKFLRDIWLECCGHMSAFMDGRDEIPKNTRIKSLLPGGIFLYDYDFGSTTSLVITVLDKLSRPKQKKPVRLIARNEAPELFCSCGKPADVICQECLFEGDEDHLFYCEACMEKHDHEMYLSVTNSPRMGQCGYDGEWDTFKFIPPENMEKDGKKPARKASSKKPKAK